MVSGIEAQPLQLTEANCYPRVMNEPTFRIDVDRVSKISWWIKFLLKFKREIVVSKKMNENVYNFVVYKKLGGVSFIISEFGTTTFSFPLIEIPIDNDKVKSA